MTQTHAHELLQGAYELHFHSAPSHMSRKMDDWEYAEHLDEYGMGGSIIKKHFSGTADRAALVNAHGGFRAKLFGTTVLNWSVGGLNPAAAQCGLKEGAKLVYLPTLHAKNQMDKAKHVLPITGPGITALDEDGKVKPVIFEIMDVVKEHNSVLCTGHLSAQESYAVILAGLEYGCRMMLTHPDAGFILMPQEQQAELAAKGAYIEKCWLNVSSNNITKEEMVQGIRLIGPEHCALATDYGQVRNPTSPEGLIQFIDALLEAGFSDEEIKRMNTVNPKEILGLS